MNALFCATYFLVAVAGQDPDYGDSWLQDGYVHYAIELLYDCKFEESLKWADESIREAPPKLEGLYDAHNIRLALAVRAEALRHLGETRESSDIWQTLKEISSDEWFSEAKKWRSYARLQTEQCANR